MSTLWNWFVVSSANSSKWALTVKGILATVITVVTMIAGFAHVQVGDLTPIADTIVAIVQALALVASLVVTLVGFVRKVVLTIRGEHAGLQ